MRAGTFVMLLAAALGFAPVALAQGMVTLGDVTSGAGSSLPLAFVEHSGRYQTAYAAVDLGIPVGSPITEIRLLGSDVGTDPSFIDLRCRVGYTNLAVNALTGTFDANFAAPPLTCLHGNVTPLATVVSANHTWYRFELTTPFIYDGVGTLLIDWSYDNRFGAALLTETAPAGEQVRGRVYLDGGNAASATGAAVPTGGNHGITFVYLAPGDGVLLRDQSFVPGLRSQPGTAVVANIVASCFGQARSLNSITLQKAGTVPDAAITGTSLYRDNNNDHLVGAGDTLLGQGGLVLGSVSFSAAPLAALTPGQPVRLLLAVTHTALQLGQTLGFSVNGAGSVSWSGGTDHSLYPVAHAPHMVRMSGLVRVANGNPGSAFDFGHLGLVFNALEANGVSGPLTIELYDDGGPFASNADCALAPAGNGGAVTGSSPVNTITIRAAAGELPVIQGSGAAVFSAFGGSTATLTLGHVSHLTIEGLTITGGQQCGLAVSSFSSLWARHVTIRGCRIHGITAGAGIFVYGNTVGPNYVTIENNMIWNCHGDAGTEFASGCKGVIAVRRVGKELIVRHNTVVHTAGAAGSGVLGQTGTDNFPMHTVQGNVFYLTHATTAFILRTDTVVTALPTNADRNVMFLGAGAEMTSHSVSTWAQWQQAGKDANGINADPLLVSLAPGTQDLHLQANSPAIDRAVGSTTPTDIDGDARPIGAAPDSGADEFLTGPVIQISRAAVAVQPAANVNVGVVNQLGAPYQFTIGNQGLANLLLTGAPPVQLTPGLNCGPGTVVQAQPAPITIAPAGSVTFTVFADPLAGGPFSLTLRVLSNDVGRSPFDFTLSGTCVLNAPATAAPAAGSSLSGPLNGPFSLVLAPGATLAAAAIVLTDAEADAITVVGITPPATALGGVATPPMPAPGQPLTLAWTGTALASNPPGVYTWVVEFNDAGSGQSVLVDISITLQDLPPAHTPAAGQPGQGTAAQPYTATFTQTLTATTVVTLAGLADPNTGQALALQGQVRVGGSAGVGAGFTFMVIGSQLRMAPAGALTAADVGTQDYEVTVTDGNNQVVIHAVVTVNAAPAFSVSTLPDADVNLPYTFAVGFSGGTGAVTVALQSGTLPPGMSVSPAGTISGTATAAGAFTFALSLTDGLGAFASQSFSLTVTAPPVAPPTNPPAAGNGCVGHPSAGAALPWVLVACTRRKRQRRQAACHEGLRR